MVTLSAEAYHGKPLRTSRISIELSHGYENQSRIEYRKDAGPLRGRKSDVLRLYLSSRKSRPRSKPPPFQSKEAARAGGCQKVSVAAVFAFDTGKVAVQIAAIETNGLLNPGQFNGTFQGTAAAKRD